MVCLVSVQGPDRDGGASLTGCGGGFHLMMADFTHCSGNINSFFLLTYFAHLSFICLLPRCAFNQGQFIQYRIFGSVAVVEVIKAQADGCY